MAASGKSGETLLPLTFGMELEMYFCINKDLVVRQPQFHHLFPQNFRLKVEDQVDDREHFDPTEEEFSGLCQAAMLLHDDDTPVVIKVNPKEDEGLFHRWQLTFESAVVFPDSDDELSDWSKGKITSMKGWEGTGLELISPIMTAPDVEARGGLEGGSFRELDRMLKRLNADPAQAPWAFMSNAYNGSVHVHVGVQPEEGEPVDIPLKVLQHLGWIVLTFEDVINLMHHPERRGYQDTKSSIHACSSRRFLHGWFQNPVPRSSHTCDKIPAYDQEKAFNLIFRQAKTHAQLQAVMSNAPTPNNPHYRNTFVNFYNIASSRIHPFAIKTVEFRQHCGTTNAGQIKEWIYFLTSLMRAAERLANMSSHHHKDPVLGERQKYQGLSASRKRTMRELFDLMELPIERRRYWWERVKHFKSAEYEEYWIHGTCNLSKDCTGWMPRNAEGYEKGEVIPKPWPPSPRK